MSRLFESDSASSGPGSVAASFRIRWLVD